MGSIRSITSLTTLLIALSLAGVAQRTAHANWESAVAASDVYFARWSYVPDFDQRRLNLPGNGAMYCVPTSYMNWMAYIAHHGYAGVNPPGDHTIYYWQSDPPFADMTGWLYDLGLLMQTHETEGTKSNNAVDGFINWMDGKGFGYYIYRYGVSGDFVPRHGNVAGWTLYKCPVILGIGWYSNNVLPPPFPPELTLIVREGGHAVSLVEVARSGNDREIGIRDPASDNSSQPFGIAIQSPATIESYAMDAEQIYLNGVGVRIMDKISGYGDGWLDGYTVIIPLSALTTVDDRLKLSIYKPALWNWDSDPQTQVIDLGLVLPAIDVRYIPGTPEACVLTPGYQDITGRRIPAETYKVNLITEEITQLASFNDATKITFGRKRQLYVLDGQVVRCINIDGEMPVEEASVSVNGNPNAIACKDSDDTVLVYSPGLSRIIAFDETLNADTAQFWNLPGEIFLEGDTSMAIDQQSGAVFITSQGSQAVYRLILRSFNNVTILPIGDGEISNPTGISIGDGSIVYVSTGNLMKVFRRDTNTGAWFNDAESPFSGMTTDGAFDIPYSRTNVDPPAPDDPAWFNVLPTQFSDGVLDCIYLDANGSGVVDFGDLTTVLANWLNDYTPGSGPGDTNGSGVVDFRDITEVLANWLATCP